jgi:Gpi18-like mannosyltransferase
LAQLSHLRKHIDSSRLNGDFLILALACILAIALRFSLFGFQSRDYVTFVSKWFDFIQTHGGFRALRFEFSNYTPPYLYLLAASAGLFPGIPKIIAVKIISLPFDFLCAFFVARILRLQGGSKLVPLAAFLAVLFTPTVVLNGAFWGQIDIIYTTGLVATVYFLMQGKEWPAFVSFGIAFAFKLQAVFLVPVLLILLMAKRISWKRATLVPLSYLLMMAPAWAVGRPLGELLTIYLSQSASVERLAPSAPNLYVWLPQNLFDMLLPAGLVWASAVILIFVLFAYKARPQMSPGLLIDLSTISVLLIPYILPKMHQRYSFPADIFSIVFGLSHPRYLIVPIFVQLVSLLSYLPYLFGYGVVSTPVLAIIQLVPLVMVVHHYLSSLHSKDEANQYQGEG